MPTLRTRVSSEASLETFEGNISLDPFEDQWGCRFRAARISNGVRSPMFRKAGPKSVRFNSNPVHEPLRPVITRPVSHNSSLTSSDYSEPSLGVSTEGLTSTTTTLALSEEQQRYARKNPYTDMEEALQENPLRCVSASAGSEFATSEPAMPKTPLCVRPTQLTLGPSLERTAEKSTQEVQSLWGLDNDAPSPLIQPPTNEQATNIRILALQEQCHLNEAVLGDQEGEITELSTKLLTLENTLHSALECQQRQRTTIENLEKARALTETKVTELQTVEEDQKKCQVMEERMRKAERASEMGSILLIDIGLIIGEKLGVEQRGDVRMMVGRFAERYEGLERAVQELTVELAAERRVSRELKDEVRKGVEGQTQRKAQSESLVGALEARLASQSTQLHALQRENEEIKMAMVRESVKETEGLERVRLLEASVLEAKEAIALKDEQALRDTETNRKVREELGRKRVEAEGAQREVQFLQVSLQEAQTQHLTDCENREAMTTQLKEERILNEGLTNQLQTSERAKSQLTVEAKRKESLDEKRLAELYEAELDNKRLRDALETTEASIETLRTALGAAASLADQRLQAAFLELREAKSAVTEAQRAVSELQAQIGVQCSTIAALTQDLESEKRFTRSMETELAKALQEVSDSQEALDKLREEETLYRNSSSLRFQQETDIQVELRGAVKMHVAQVELLRKELQTKESELELSSHAIELEKERLFKKEQEAERLVEEWHTRHQRALSVKDALIIRQEKRMETLQTRLEDSTARVLQEGRQIGELKQAASDTAVAHQALLKEEREKHRRLSRAVALANEQVERMRATVKNSLLELEGMVKALAEQKTGCRLTVHFYLKLLCELLHAFRPLAEGNATALMLEQVNVLGGLGEPFGEKHMMLIASISQYTAELASLVAGRLQLCGLHAPLTSSLRCTTAELVQYGELRGLLRSQQADLANMVGRLTKADHQLKALRAVYRTGSRSNGPSTESSRRPSEP